MRLAIKTCTLDMPFPDMLDFCCTHHVSAVEIGTGNWSNAPHIDLEALVTSNSARIKWHDEIRRRGAVALRSELFWESAGLYS